MADFEGACLSLLFSSTQADFLSSCVRTAELTKAVEGNDSDQIQQVVSRIELEKLKDDLDVKRRIAMRRSGARYVCDPLAVCASSF